MRAVHPGYRETIKSKPFQAWLGNQLKSVQKDFATTNDPESFIEVLNSYEASARNGNGRTSDRERRKASSRGVPTKKKPSIAGESGGWDTFEDGWRAAKRELESERRSARP